MLRPAAILFVGLMLVTAMGCAADWGDEPEGVVALQSGETLPSSGESAEVFCTSSPTADEYTCADSSEPADELQVADDVAVSCGCGCSGCSADYECVYDCNPDACCNACKEGLPPCA